LGQFLTLHQAQAGDQVVVQAPADGGVLGVRLLRPAPQAQPSPGAPVAAAAAVMVQ
jgi:hypothetical protein